MKNRLIWILNALALFWLVPICEGQLQVREATAAEMSAGTVGLPAVVTPRRFAAGSSANAVTNFASLDGSITVVSSAADLPYLSPSAVSNSPSIFGPWSGSNWVQLAINALPQGSATTVGGGTINVVGTIVCPSTLTITPPPYAIATVGTNDLMQTNAFGITFRAAKPIGCGLVLYGNPGILISNVSPPGGNIVSMINLNIEKMFMIEGLDGVTNYLIYESAGAIGNQHWVDSYFAGSWYQATNNQLFKVKVGLATESTHSVPWTNWSGINIQGVNGELCKFENCHFAWLAGVVQKADHSEWDNNLFTACGWKMSDTRCHMAWSTNSIMAGHGAIIQPNVFNDCLLIHNNFYDCGAAYFCAVDNGTLQRLSDGSSDWVSEFDKYETTDYTSVYLGNDSNTPFTQINSLGASTLHSAYFSGAYTTDGNFVFTGGQTNLTADAGSVGSFSTEPLYWGGIQASNINGLTVTEYIQTNAVGPHGTIHTNQGGVLVGIGKY